MGFRQTVIAAVVLIILAGACGEDSNSWSKETQAAYTDICRGVSRALGVEDPAALCGCILEELQQEFSEEDYLAMPQADRDEASDSFAPLCARRLDER
jgi:hypothetical protein